jgi:putative transposase
MHVCRAVRRRLLKLGQKIGPAIKHLITIVTYRTFLRWLAGDKAGRTSGKRGRPRTDAEIREIIIRLAKENGWGYTRILGELKKVGIRKGLDKGLRSPSTMACYYVISRRLSQCQ